MLPPAADECLHGDIIRGVRRREPGIDLVLVEEVGLRGRTDPDVLEWAAREGRILITQDEHTMIGHAYDRVKAGLPMPGVLVRGKGVTIRQAIDDLILVACCGTAEDFRDQVKFLSRL
jgi:predicted nuclease of predicted toxin-antitoxin system